MTTSVSANQGSRTPGERQFLRCSACHTMNADAAPLAGPHLAQLIGRRAGSLEDFAYTEQLHDQDLVWDESTLDAWLRAPHDLYPGMCMPFMGLRRESDREVLIRYLSDPETN